MKNMSVIFFIFITIQSIYAGKDFGLSLSFTKEQSDYIAQNDLWFWTQKLCSLNIPNLKSDNIVELAQLIKEQNLPSGHLEENIKKNLLKKILIYPAVDMAIITTKKQIWRAHKFRAIQNENRNFVTAIKDLKLKSDYEYKLLSVYTQCIVPFENENDKRLFFTPTVAEAKDGYTIPCKINNEKQAKESKTNLDVGYNYLINEAKATAQAHNVNEKEKMLMAKCIGEKSLKFFFASKNPPLALVKTIQHHTNKPTKNFFMQRGICTNFVDITYDVAQHLDLTVTISRKKYHTYLKAQLDGTWYHIHPFNSENLQHNLIEILNKIDNF